MKIKRILGLDPGLYGAYTLLDIQGGVLEFANFQTIQEKKKARSKSKKASRVDVNLDLVQMGNLFERFRDGETIAYLEFSQAFQKEGASSSHKSGKGYGVLLGLCVAFPRIPFLIITPQKWTKAMHIPGDPSPDAKVRSRSAFRKSFIDMATTPKKIHNGIVDSTLIAEYGRQRINAGLDIWEFENQIGR
ncbi:MAG: hypothetical protein V3R67_03515 [Thermodesulfobacteriota bacterium]